MKTIERMQSSLRKIADSEKGGLAGYGLAWLLGVPLSVLIIAYLIFGR